MARFWPLVLPLPGLGWWLLGFPPGGAWLIAPLFPSIPISLGTLLILLLVLVGVWGLTLLAIDRV